jgi:hypothetical protein
LLGLVVTGLIPGFVIGTACSAPLGDRTDSGTHTGTGQSDASSTTTVRPPLPPEPPPSLSGVTLDGFDTDDAGFQRRLDRLEQLGVQWVRVVLRLGPGLARAELFDRRLEELRRNGIGVVGVLGGSAESCSADPQPPNDPIWCPPALDRLDRYEQFIEAVVTRYGELVHWWESWNEPDHPEFWLGRTPDPAYYARVLTAQHRALQRAQPDGRLLLAATGPTNLAWIAAVLEELGTEHPFDGVALHPYRYDGGPDDRLPFRLADGTVVHATMAEELLLTGQLFAEHAARAGRPGVPPDTWITEVGWGARSAEGGEIVDSVKLVSYDTQARYLGQLVELLRSSPELRWIRGMLWFRLVDLAEDPPRYQFARWYGLFTAELDPKPAAKRFEALARAS